MTMTLGPDYATMDDCNNLWTDHLSGGALPSPMPVFIGYLVVLSPVELDVDVVYTARCARRFDRRSDRHLDRC